jgi:hypothetical protein
VVAAYAVFRYRSIGGALIVDDLQNVRQLTSEQPVRFNLMKEISSINQCASLDSREMREIEAEEAKSLLQEDTASDKVETSRPAAVAEKTTTSSTSAPAAVAPTRLQPTDADEEDEDEDFDYQADTVMTILKPVSLTMLFVIWGVKTIEEETSGTTR